MPDNEQRSGIWLLDSWRYRIIWSLFVALITVAFILLGIIGIMLIAGCATPTGRLRQSIIIPPTSAAAPVIQCHSINGRADRTCNPGAINPLVTQNNIARTICVSGWTKTVRPPVSYTNAEKRQERAAYGLTAGPDSDYEEDHIIALELGGDPGYTRGPQGLPANLWPELWNGTTGAHVKDQEENLLHRQVCSNALTLLDAQRKITADWVH